MMKIINLNKWKVAPSHKYYLLRWSQIEKNEIDNTFNFMDIELPGSLYKTLEKEGLISDIYKGLNSLSAEWVKDRWWLYRTEFEGEGLSANTYLHFDSVDYKCRIYLNGKLIDSHIGAIVPFEVCIGKHIVKGENRLDVVVESVEEFGQFGYSELVKTQRPRFDYGWDFATQLVNIGIYRKVYVVSYKSSKIDEFYFKPVKPANKGRALLSVRTTEFKEDKCEICAELFDNDGNVAYTGKTEVKNCAADLTITVKNVNIWQPNGEGKPYCYLLKITLIDGNGNVIDSKKQSVGFRDIEYLVNESAPENSLPYTFIVNGKRLWIRGFNITPLDQLLGTESEERYERMILAAKECNANMLRVWGGGIIEQDIFYELCSKHGLLVYQDMVQSSSGLGNSPSVIPELLELLKETCEYTTKTKRNYPCIAAFCGGNEFYDDNLVPDDLSHLNLAMLNEICNKNCPEIIFYATTGSGPYPCITNEDAINNHDVHGAYKYLGYKEHYDFYNKSNSLFIGETGCAGMASYGQIERIIPKADLKVVKLNESNVWHHHSEWWDMSREINDIFGKITDLKTYVNISQFLQAEGLEYIVSHFRRLAPRQSGCLIWQLNELWPYACCTTLIDYYGAKKPAYYSVKRAFDKTAISFKYDSLIYNAGEELSFDIYITGDEDICGKLSYEIYAGSSLIKSESVDYNTKALNAVRLKGVKLKVPQCNFVKVKAAAYDGKAYHNEKIFLVRGANGHCDSSIVLNEII